MIQGLSGAHLIVIVFIIVLLFGAPKLPALAKSLGQSLKILKKEVGGDESGETPAAPAAAAPASATTAPATSAGTAAPAAASAAAADADLPTTGRPGDVR
ncbi:twin-arginine translocase TatA/TatE family subunit [Leucobacter sp. CSA1]|uniref:Sec-independent protein translocase protein TatA n=1 Tax=Leucobacter chromiisoli TaxID=2796471 RepID=A0A934Q778_9MICO|nr:twin-arginine translocase TatA/TatE family subunit [Leucobacter chromiisoli]MBK0417832.1 twin-arginine translocase TatA/TatE family subunit [Leucobacter chromiisoli]